MITAFILTHGSLGSALLESVERVIGPQKEVTVLSNENLSLEQIQELAKSHLNERPCVFFVDTCGGSPYVACASLLPADTSSAVISGVNLPMLISFFTKRDSLPFHELVSTVETDGHRGIMRVPS